MSPSTFSYSVAVYFYQWRWENFTAATAKSDILSAFSPPPSAGMNDSARSVLLPKLNCVWGFRGVKARVGHEA